MSDESDAPNEQPGADDTDTTDTAAAPQAATEGEDDATAVELEDAGTGDETDEDADAGDAGPSDDTEVDIELDGKAEKVSLKELKTGYARQRDATIKTQAAARLREEAELVSGNATRQAAELEARQVALNAQTAVHEDKVKLGVLDQQLAYFRNLNWTKLRGEAEDPASVDNLWDQSVKLQADRDALAGELTGKEKAATEAHQQATLKGQEALSAAVEAGDKALTTRINGWNPDLRVKTLKYGIESYKFTSDEAVQALADPRMVEVLHRAMVGDAARAELKALKAKMRGEKVAPAKTIEGGRQAPAKVSTADPRSDKASTDAWFEAERKRVDKKAAEDRKKYLRP